MATESPTSMVSIEAEEVSRQVDSLGSERVIYKEAKSIIELIELKVEDKAKVDSLLSLLNIERKQLKEVRTVYAEVKQDNIRLRRKDSTYFFNDKNLSLSFTPKSDSLSLGSFAYNLDLHNVQYWKRSWFLGKKEPYIEVWSPDKRVSINGLDRVAIKQKTPIMNIGAGVVGNYTHEGLSYGAGASVGVRRFAVKGEYLYYPHLEQWHPSVSLWYDLLRF